LTFALCGENLIFAFAFDGKKGKKKGDKKNRRLKTVF
jgi:hypothetical protein